jgi:hypothetical protein
VPLPIPPAVSAAPALKPRQRTARASLDDGLTKTERLLTLVSLRRGELTGIPLAEVSKIATAYAPEVDMHPASARSALLAAVRATLPAGEGDAR